jgi:uncharacterized membrane protein
MNPLNTLEKKVENVEERVNFVESALGHIIVSTTSALNRLEKEMKEFKDEMKEFKDEMKEFKNEMLEYKNWSKSIIENMNAQWGNLARKMGTLVEDIFYPSAEIVIKKFFNVLPDFVSARKLVRKNGMEFEADILALCSKEKMAFICNYSAKKII